MRRYSYSRLAAADKCLASFYERYERKLEDKLPSTYSKMREVGKAVHSCVERYKQELHSMGMDQDLSLVPLIVEEVMSHDREVTTTEIYNDVFFVFGAFAKKYRHNPKTYLGAEVLLERALPESDVIIEGYPDHIDIMVDKDGPIVVTDDLKTGYRTSVSDDDEFQGELMSWILLEWFEGQRAGWKDTFPRTDFSSEIVEFKASYSPRLEARIRSIIARVDRARDEKKWPATPGSACAYCPIAAKCREKNVLVKNEVIITTPEEAQKAADDLVILSAAYDQRRDQLKAWTAEEGPIQVGDSKVGFEAKLGGIKIADLQAMILQLGMKEAVAQQYVKGEDDPILDTDEGGNLIVAVGLKTAIDASLLSINGNKTKNKSTQDDPRLSGLWVAGESSSSFGIFKPKKEKK